ncbi:MAG: ATP-binding protein [Myxococcota bacterium]|nr:ATP-binding protein [Myxococcota bacterium]
MTAGKVALTTYGTIAPHDSVVSIECRLLQDGFLVVKNNEDYIGILTVEDMIKNPHLLVVDCLSDRPRVVDSQTLEDVLALMEQGSHRFLPVFRDEVFYGVVNYRGIAQSLRLERDRMRGIEHEHRSRAAQFDAMRALAGGIAHDFKNYLMSIIGAVELAAKDPGISPKNADHLKAASHGISKAGELAEQLFTFSRHGALVKEKTDIAKLVEENAKFALRGRGLQLELSFSNNLEKVELSNTQFGRVVNNLVLNAAQAMSDTGGALFIEGESTRVDEESDLPLHPGKYVKISFRDTGPGIPQNILPQVFEPYFTTKSTGSGLGLAIVYSVVTDHGGYVEVASEEGRGATFLVYLPMAREPEPCRSPPLPT